MKEQVQSKKWVDYSDSDSPDEESPEIISKVKSNEKSKQVVVKQEKKKFTYRPSRQQTDKQLDKLDDLRHDKIDQVWLDMFSQNIDYLQQEMNYLKEKARKGGDIVAVFSTNQQDQYEIKVYINVAYDYIQKGFDAYDYIKVTVSPKNLQKQTSKRDTRYRDRKDFKPEYKDKSNITKEGDKKKYVDKQTGKAPETNKKSQEPVTTERKYTKEEAQKKGQMIGQFRNKQLKEKPAASNGQSINIDTLKVGKYSQNSDEQTQNIKNKQASKLKEVSKKIEQERIKQSYKSNNEPNKQKQVKKKYQDQKVDQTKAQKEVTKKQKKPQGSKIKFQNHFEGILDL